MNVQRIDRLRRLAKVLSFGGLGLMVVALVLSLGAARNMGVTLGLALVGLLASQIGTMLMRRWPDRGRSDQVLDAALKGLDSRCSLVHYALGCRHALFTPRAVVALIPVGEPGSFEWRDETLWRTKLKRGEPTGKPAPQRATLDDGRRETADLERHLHKLFPERASWDIVPLFVFFHAEARLQPGEGPPSVHLKKLKEHVRNLPRRAPLSESEAARLAAEFEPLHLNG
jgi:hypothetical protein